MTRATTASRVPIRGNGRRHRRARARGRALAASTTVRTNDSGSEGKRAATMRRDYSRHAPSAVPPSMTKHARHGIVMDHARCRPTRAALVRRRARSRHRRRRPRQAIRNLCAAARPAAAVALSRQAPVLPGILGAVGRLVRSGARRNRRHHRSQRLRQIDAAAVDRRHADADHRHGDGARAGRGAARARQRLQSRILRPRERVSERCDPRPCAQRNRSTAASHRRVFRASRSSSIDRSRRIRAA